MLQYHKHLNPWAIIYDLKTSNESQNNTWDTQLIKLDEASLEPPESIDSS